jgi:chorismate mutase-like protein
MNCRRPAAVAGVGKNPQQEPAPTGTAMTKTGESEALALADLRARIDAIDERLHRLLIERSSVIDALIRAKGTSAPAAAFRPGREADMMRRLVARHSGALPLSAVEHIWREIISTFTHMQAPYALVVDGAADAAAMRDLARFYFSFSVPIETLPDASAVVVRVASTGRDLGLVAMDQPPRAGAWWRGLVGEKAPRIMALLPFIRMPERPAALPAFVVAPPLSDPTPADIAIYAARAGDGPHAIAGAEILAAAGNEILIALPTADEPRILPDARLADIVRVGGVARGISIGSSDSLLYAPAEMRKEPA